MNNNPMCPLPLSSDPDLMSKIRAWVDDWRIMLSLYQGDEMAMAFARYAIHSSPNLKEIDMKQYLANELDLEWDYVPGSIVDQIIQRKEREGIQRGIQRGRQEGRQEGAASLLLNLLHMKFSNAVTPTVEHQIVHAEAANLDEWSRRVLSADTLEDVFRSTRD